MPWKKFDLNVIHQVVAPCSSWDVETQELSNRAPSATHSFQSFFLVLCPHERPAMSDIQCRKQCELVAREQSFFLVLCPHERPAMSDTQFHKPHEMVAKEQ